MHPPEQFPPPPPGASPAAPAATAAALSRALKARGLTDRDEWDVAIRRPRRLQIR